MGVADRWLKDELRFHDECLLIPSDELRALCEPSELGGHLSFDWHPVSRRQTQLDRYRIPALALLSQLEKRNSGFAEPNELSAPLLTELGVWTMVAANEPGEERACL